MARSRKKTPSAKLPVKPGARSAAPRAYRNHGTAIVAQMSSPYDASGGGPRLAHWNGSGLGVNTLIHHHAPLIRQRSRDVSRNNAIAFRAVDNLVSALVGNGIKPHSLCEDLTFRRDIEAAWKVWVKQSDPTRASDFYGQQAVMVRAMIEGGEALARFRERLPSDNLFIPLQLQLMEPEQLDDGRDTINLPGGRRISRGIEFDDTGAPVAYWFHREHPGENTGRTVAGNSVRVPASQVIHLYEPLRPGQVGGLPWLSVALVQLHELDQYNDAEVVRKKSAAMIMGFITALDAGGALPGEDGGTDGYEDPDGESVGLEVASPGTMLKLLPGEGVEFNNPADVGGNYEAFVRANLRLLAGAARQTYEQLSGDYSDVTYSSARQAILEFRRKMEQIQAQIIVHQLCAPVWDKFVRAAIISGRVQVPGGVAAFVNGPHQFCEVKWVPTGWQWIDPFKEVQADKLAMESRLKSRKRIIAERTGEDIDDVDAEIDADPHHPKAQTAAPTGRSIQAREEIDTEEEEDEESEASEAV